MDWIATLAIIDPDHNQPTARCRPTDHLMRLAISKGDLDSISIAKHLLNFFKRDVPFGMVGAQVPAISGIPDDPPIVHPFSIYERDGQIGVASGT